MSVEQVKQGKHHYSYVNNVAIMGAGVAGLQVADQLTRAGFSVVVFEKANDVGGVWRKNYADFGLQVPRELFEFPGFPYPESEEWDQFPKGADVHKYIRAFTESRDLRKHIRFQTCITQVKRKPEGRGWTVVSEQLPEAGGEKKSEQFDFVVVCTGMYSSPPNIPKAEGSESFKGELLHSCKFTDRNQAKGKKVVVVGGGKSAVDCAVAAKRGGATDVTLLFREAHWPVPRKLLNLVPFKFGTYSRFGHAMLPAHWDMDSVTSSIHTLCRPVKWVWWRTVELMFQAQFMLSGDLKPDSNIEVDVFNGGQILDYSFRDMLSQKVLATKKGAITRYEAEKVVLSDGTDLEADLVVYGTGFKKSYDYLEEEARSKLALEKDGLWLYRNVIPPNLDGLAFVGSEVSTFNNILTHGLQSMWLSKVLTGEIQLPGPEGMAQVVSKEQDWKRGWMPDKPCRASIYQLHMVKYHDMLCQDMQVQGWGKGWNVIAGMFGPYQASDYKMLFEVENKVENPKSCVEGVEKTADEADKEVVGQRPRRQSECES